MEKSVKINVEGVETEIKGFDTERFRYYCDNGILAEYHEIKGKFYLCEVRTGCGNRIMVVCKKCFKKIKDAQWFIREVPYDRR